MTTRIRTLVADDEPIARARMLALLSDEPDIEVIGECADGPQAIAAIEQRERLASYPFFPAALAELELRAGRPSSARRHFREARQLARNPAERRFLQQRESACGSGQRNPTGTDSRPPL